MCHSLSHSPFLIFYNYCHILKISGSMLCSFLSFFCYTVLNLHSLLNFCRVFGFSFTIQDQPFHYNLKEHKIPSWFLLFFLKRKLKIIKINRKKIELFTSLLGEIHCNLFESLAKCELPNCISFQNVSLIPTMYLSLACTLLRVTLKLYWMVT